MDASPSASGPTPGSSGKSSSNQGDVVEKKAFFDPMRAYRACLHCRSRKTKCNLDVNGGKPPCKRCQREDRECVLGESHRGGRRVRKKPKLEDAGKAVPEVPSTLTPVSTKDVQSYASQQAAQPYEPLHHDSYNSWHDSAQGSSLSDMRSDSRQEQVSHTSRGRQDDVTHLQLHNPSDALGILARVADNAESGTALDAFEIDRAKTKYWTSAIDPDLTDDFAYPPITCGRMPIQKVYDLFDAFEQNYHAHFPVVSQESFYRPRMSWMSKAQPHLFAAILTIGSRDDFALHQICYKHMQALITDIVCGGDADTEAVEALLLLSQWICHRPQPRAESLVGRGEEDRVAWMYIGLALRLGWYLGIDKSAYDLSDQSEKTSHERLVWSACYLADRNVSIRVGKGFWARAPGPLLDEATNDFPTLAREPGREQLGQVWQAQLKLTQLFSNVSDVLYSTTSGASWKEMLQGRYAKHLDDFRVAIDQWISKWGNLDCSDRLKAGMLITWDYLRLYVNAFAYQANISRAMTRPRQSPTEPIPLLDASSPDSRFIYEAIDSAKSIIKRVNAFATPEQLRYMPCRFYLYVVYSAVFLYKARSTTTMDTAERDEIRNMVAIAIRRLGESSQGSNQMGARYARLLDMLWRKTPAKASTKSQSQTPQPQLQDANQNIDHRLLADPSNLQQRPSDAQTQSNMTDSSIIQAPILNYDANISNYMGNNFVIPPNNISNELNMNAFNTNMSGGPFSWLDINGAWEFASHQLPLGMMDDQGLGNGFGGMEGMDLGVVGDFRSMKNSGQGLIF